MKRWICLAALAALLLLLSGCTAVEDALARVNADMQAAKLDTPDNDGGDIDWGFVPVVREMATTLFSDSFPEAQITGTGVASRNGASDRVIVTIDYALDGKTGSYGFDYEKNEAGEYELRRYGEGVSSDDL